MSVFIAERDGDGQELRIVFGREFADRSEAVQALTAALAAGEVELRGDALLVDLESAVPLVIVAVPMTREAPAEETPAVVDAEVAGHADEDASGIAAALKRAATSLEAEGIVAPESVPAGPDVAGYPAEAADVEGIEEMPVPEPDVETPPWAIIEAADVVPETAASPEGDVEGGSEPWPWEHVSAYEPMPEPATADDTAAAAGDAREALAPEPAEPPIAPDAAVVSAEPESVSLAAEPPGSTEAVAEGEDVLDDEAVSALIEALSGEPVATIAEPASVVEEAVSPAEIEDAEDDPLADALASIEEPAVTESPLIISSALDGDEAYLPRPVILGDYEDGPASTPEAAADAPPDGVEPEATAYVPGAELDLAAYTCDDCIYVNTCPKVGQSTPAECGSFQWKAQ